jgi:hypothetical protein
MVKPGNHPARMESATAIGSEKNQTQRRNKDSVEISFGLNTDLITIF